MKVPPSIAAWKKTWHVLKKKPLHFLPPMISDLVLILVFGNILWFFLARKLNIALGDAFYLIEQQNGGGPLQQLFTLSGQNLVSTAAEVNAHFYEALGYGLLLALGSIILWIVFQGFS